MKNKDVFYLSRISEKNNPCKRSIIVCLAISTTILIFIIFMILSINLGIHDKIKKEPLNYSCIVENKSEASSVEDCVSFKELACKYNCIDYAHYEYRTINYKKDGTKINYPYVMIDNNRYNISYDYSDFDLIQEHYWKKQNDTFLKYDVKMVLDNECKSFGSSFILEGSEPSKNEILISSILLDYYNIDYKTVIGKEISYYLDLEEKIFGSTIISGVFDYKFFDYIQIRYYQGNPLIMFFDNDNISMDKSGEYEAFSFDRTKDIESFINSCEKNSYSTDFLDTYLELKDVFSLMQIIFLITGLVIFSVTMINMFINYSYLIKSKFGYMNMLEILGSSKKDIKKSLIIQITITNLKGLLISIVLSFVFAIVIAQIWDKMIFEDSLIHYKLNLGYYFVSLAIVLVVVFALDYLYTTTIYRNYCKNIKKI